MKKYGWFVVVIVIVVTILLIKNNSNNKNILTNITKNNEEEYSLDMFGDYYAKANKTVKKMTLDEKIGQLFLVRYDENYAPRWVKDYHVGGFVMFAKDFDGKTKESIFKEIKNLQDISNTDLIIAVDEEGGFVTRVSRYPAFRETKFLAPRDYYNEGGYELLEKTEVEKAKLLLSLGINLNLAPVADVSTNEEDFINNRTFGKGAEETADYIKHMVEYANSVGISSSLKHFPGYGNNVDTHNGVAIDNREYENFVNNDYLPFIAGIEANVPTILVSHNLVNCIDDKYPASLSKKVNNELREKLGFSGIIITDDLAMDAVGEYTNNSTAATMAVNAGNDLIITSSLEDMYAEIKKSVEDDVIKEETIDLAVKRILAYKLAYGI